ncbi:MAG: pyridoxal phosphate-dependent aminotransferase [Methyloligellaceae bacterium]
MTGKPRLASIIDALPSTVPFVGPEAQERQMGFSFKARIGANENVFGPSPKAIRAMQDAVPESWQYGDPESFDLKVALSEHHGIAPENIMVGEGIDGLLGYVARMMIEPGSPVVTSRGAYPTFNYHVAACGGNLLTVPYRQDREDLEALIATARSENAKLIYFANPDNPMGTWWSADELNSLISVLPDDILLCLDEAYIELAPENTAPPVDTDRPNVLRFRTFSKAYGMAGARVGYVMGEAQMIKNFDKIRNHFGMCRTSQIGALAALKDQSYLASVIHAVDQSRNRIKAIAEKFSLSAIESAANFVAIDCGRDGNFAKSLLSELSSQGIFIRMPAIEPQNRCIRVSAGTEEDLDNFEEALSVALTNLKYDHM